MRLEILSLSDRVEPYVDSPEIRRRFAGVDLVIGCGDLPYSYLEYVQGALDVPAFFVRGNHASLLEEGPAGPQAAPLGAVDLHRRVVCWDGLLLAGVEGCRRYRPGPFQYSQAEMWRHVLRLLPGLLLNRLRHGRYLDLFVTHAPSWRLNDLPDLAHQGIRAFRWLVATFRPAIHFHGHVHAYHVGALLEDRLGSTRVINTYGYRQVGLELPGRELPGWRRSARRGEIDVGENAAATE